MHQEENIGIFVRNRIKELRVTKGYTVNSLAIHTGISQSYIRDIEQGNKANISVEKLYMICQVLGVSLHDFFDGDLSGQDISPLHKKNKHYEL